MTIFEIAEKFRAELARRQAGATAKLLESYVKAWADIETELSKIAAKVAEAQAQGVTPSAAWRFQKERLQSLQEDLARRILDLANTTADRTTVAQTRTVQAAQEYVKRTLDAARKPLPAPTLVLDFRRLSNETLQQYVGFMGDGSELKKSFERLARDMGVKAADEIGKAVERGIALQKSPAQIAAMIRQAVDANGGTLADPAVVRRLKLAAHSSVLYSAREATRAGYAENGVTHWRWSSAKSATTCAACWALDGRIFEIDTPQGAHPNCKCTLLPIVEANPADQTTGVDEFERLTDTTKRTILGNALFNAYTAGKITLADTVGTRESAGYGTQYGTRSLADILGDTAARRFYG